MSPLLYSFDIFELDPGNMELRRAGEICELGHQAFEVLRYVLDRSGRVVTRKELAPVSAGKGRGGRALLQDQIREIREVLNTGLSRDLLQTVRGQGYRFGCRVERKDGRLAERALVAGPARRAYPPSARSLAPDPAKALAQVNGVLSLALQLGDLASVRRSLDLLIERSAPAGSGETHFSR
jgi:DNA-binding winged helix-turn-helix (wHTH) protein